MKRRILSLILCAVMFTAFLSISASAIGMDNFQKTRTYEQQFSDITGKWCEACIADLYEYGLAEGVSEGKMAPETDVTTAELITLGARINAAYYGREIPAAEGEWYKPYIAYALEHGLADEALVSNVSRSATRAETAQVLRKTLPVEQFEAVNKEKTFFDVLMLDRYYDAVSVMTRAGVITGYEDMSFRPDAHVTRAEALTMADRVVNKSMRVGYHTSGGGASYGKRDEEVGDYVTFECPGIAIFTMNRRDEGFVLSVATGLTGESVATFSGMSEYWNTIGLVCPLGNRIIKPGTLGEDVTSLLFSYDEGRVMKLIGAVKSDGTYIDKKDKPVIGFLRIGAEFTATT